MVQEKKKEIVEELAERLRGAAATVLVDYRGMTVDEATRLRRQCRKAEVAYRVIKNRLARRAFDATGLAPPEEVMRGPTALAFTPTEVSAPARVLADFAKTCEHLVIKGGFLGDRWLEVAGVEQLAKIPPRDVLLAHLAGSMRSPLTRLAWVLKAPIAQVAMAFKALADQKAGQEVIKQTI